MILAQDTCSEFKTKLDNQEMEIKLLKADLKDYLDLKINQTQTQIEKNRIADNIQHDADLKAQSRDLVDTIKTETSPYKLTIPIMITCLAMFCLINLYLIASGR
jgi:hypothetical protein